MCIRDRFRKNGDITHTNIPLMDEPTYNAMPTYGLIFIWTRYDVVVCTLITDFVPVSDSDS